MNTPDSADCASSVALGRFTLLLHAQRRTGRRVVLGPDRDPVTVLHLLHAHQVVAVVARSVEAQLALDRVDAVRLDVRADRLVIEASGALHTRLEDLPRGVRR